MKRRRVIAVLMRISSWVLLACAAIVAFGCAFGMGGEGSGAPVSMVLTLVFIGLICWWISAGDEKKSR